MISKVVMPDLGATGADIRFDGWLAKAGDYVKSGDPLFVVTTDKATVEVEAFRNGYVRQLLVSAGEDVPPGSELAILADSPDEPLEPFAIPGDDQSEETGIPGRHSGSEPGGAKEVPVSRILASPLARRMAKEAGIELRWIKGSGRHGEILKRDVQSAVEARQADSGWASETFEPPFRRERLSPMRRAVAIRTRLSKSEIPHFYASITADMTEASRLLKRTPRRATKHGLPVPTLNDLFIRAAALSLREAPQINASFREDEIWYYEHINIGFVIGLPEGMLVPVIRRADLKNIFQLASETRRLIESAKSGTLNGNDLGGGTFTITNLGMYGLDAFTAVINPPQAGMLAIGAAREAPANWEGQIQLRAQVTATLSVDHRAVDGITAARFMKAFKELLEDPFILFLPETQEEA
jgi:pyruvate dehydrogenase E2 component (dihydrolipoamide acetyltransferase)